MSETMRQRTMGRFESLERRLCLAVTAVLSDGDLVVEGDSDSGAVSIVATGEGAYEVTDGATVIAVDGVDDDIRIQLDAEAGADDVVTIDLGGNSVDRVMARLGGGANQLIIGGGAARHVYYRGGDGADAVEIASDMTIEGSVLARLGAGDNEVLVDGVVERGLAVLAGEGNDDVTVNGEVGRLLAFLGDGDNHVSVGGQIDGALSVRGGSGDDTVSLLAGSAAARSVSVALGDGANRLEIAGEVDGHVRYRGGADADTVDIAETAAIERSVRIRLGEGENSVVHAGAIGGDLSVSSANAEDEARVDVSAGTVAGQTRLDLGGESDRFGLGGRLRRLFGFRRR